ncbi:dimeric dUTPase (all-alpha-NTP-PPase superfamily) [Paenibacillus shirakamiensis]|uniref:Dimeric dUTPase (All-alpha-NTP-PPase superfamily) n=1 Tax=Paenibacillus shirakamiensis TaxID=1265935 RepID=A0ABS4JDE4_9BACL|nr:dUTP diphosphatase [Paenibacillus shirakamiensis]MBP1999733.1 dimeric dUTPase (all-alpha-NTP-PPase superfamily) [Paenibacillus shirakamiensis]
MNLSPLFEMQRELDKRIVKEKELEGQDLLPQKILALQVELGECANEWRGFKFWSNRQLPTEPEYNWKPNEDGSNLIWETVYGYKKHPLLEEYIDCLHFILSIGLEIEIDIQEFGFVAVVRDTTNENFLALFERISEFSLDPDDWNYEQLVDRFFGLGEMLGFNWEQIEVAYKTKWEINQQRQTNGY